MNAIAHSSGRRIRLLAVVCTTLVVGIALVGLWVPAGSECPSFKFLDASQPQPFLMRTPYGDSVGCTFHPATDWNAGSSAAIAELQRAGWSGKFAKKEISFSRGREDVFMYAHWDKSHGLVLAEVQWRRPANLLDKLRVVFHQLTHR